ncbi:hypothetical protein JCM21900_001094 [Sporobolomyces salmonicolor]
MNHDLETADVTHHTPRDMQLMPQASDPFKGTSLASRLSREGAGDFGHQLATIEATGYYKRVGNPVLTFVSSIFCMTKGETFSSTVFGVFGGFYFSYAAILTPAFGVAAAFANDAAGLNNALAIFLFVFNGLSPSPFLDEKKPFSDRPLSTGAFICIFLASLRTNICLVVLFFGVVMGGA